MRVLMLYHTIFTKTKNTMSFHIQDSELLLQQIYFIPSLIFQLIEAMEGLSSNSMMKEDLALSAKKQIKIKKFNSVQQLVKELQTESGPSTYTLSGMNEKRTYSAGSNNRQTLQNVLHIRPCYTLGSFLKTIEIIGNSISALQIKKIRSFPSNKFQIVNSKGDRFELLSNFMGSKYQLTKDGITHLTIVFQVGCGNIFRSFTIFALLQVEVWKTLFDVGITQDLSELYEKGNNFEHISKLVNLEPTICPSRNVFAIHFSRQYVVPCVQNSIICNVNGQKMLQMVKIDKHDDIFQMSIDKRIPLERVIAIAIATFDFKISVE